MNEWKLGSREWRTCYFCNKIVPQFIVCSEGLGGDFTTYYICHQCYHGICNKVVTNALTAAVREKREADDQDS